MRFPSIVIGVVVCLAYATVVAQDSGAMKVTVSLQTGSPSVPLGLKTDRDGPAPVAKAATGSELAAMTVLAVEDVDGPAPRMRRIDYSSDQVVIVGLAADGSERTRTVMMDPRLVRAEAILGEADLVTTRFYLHSVDFPILIDDAEVVTVQILKPRWTGGDWQFDLIAAAPL